MVAGLLSRKADAFAALLDGTAKSGAAQDPALAKLAGLTQRLQGIPQPSAAFHSALRQQLVSAAAQQATTSAATAGAGAGTLPAAVSTQAAGSGAAAGSGGAGLTSTMATLGKSAPLFIKLFTGVMAVAVSATGVGIGAHRALPGDLLYGVKRQVEAVQLDLASGARDKAVTELGFAHARSNELAKLLDRAGVKPNLPVSSATAGHVRRLLTDWAQEAGVATTSLIQQIQSLGSAQSTAALSADLRKTLQTFTSQQFLQLGGLLRDLPAGSLQSLTVSALGFLQRVDGVLGGDPGALVQQLPIPLSSIKGLSTLLPQLILPSGRTGTLGNGKVLPKPRPSGVTPKVSGVVPSPLPSLNLPTTLPSLTRPSVGPSGIVLPSTGGILPSTGILPSVGTLGNGTGTGTGSNGGVVGKVGGAVTGSVGNTVNGAGKTVTGAVGGTGQTVTGAVGGVVGTVTGGLSSSTGPSLPLPTALPTLPKLPGLG